MQPTSLFKVVKVNAIVHLGTMAIFLAQNIIAILQGSFYWSNPFNISSLLFVIAGCANTLLNIILYYRLEKLEQEPPKTWYKAALNAMHLLYLLGTTLALFYFIIPNFHLLQGYFLFLQIIVILFLLTGIFMQMMHKQYVQIHQQMMREAQDDLLNEFASED